MLFNKWSSCAVGVLLSAGFGTPACASAITYNDRASLATQLGSSFTDGYDEAGYGSGFKVFSDAAMTAVKGETAYQTTGFPNNNIVFDQKYCAGCNGSFNLNFSNTSFGTNLGVFGVGLNYSNSQSTPYSAFVTFGDGETEDFLLSTTQGSMLFFGITSTKSIYSIDFGLSGGQATKGGSFVIDNLTIGSAMRSAVPEPSTWMMMILGFGAIGYAMRRKTVLRYV